MKYGTRGSEDPPCKDFLVANSFSGYQCFCLFLVSFDRWLAGSLVAGLVAHWLAGWLTRLLTHLLAHLLARLPARSLACLLTCLLTCWLACLLAHLLVRSFAASLGRLFVRSFGDLFIRSFACSFVLLWCGWNKTSEAKDMKRRQSKHNEANETKHNEMKHKEAKQSETKQDEIKQDEIARFSEIPCSTWKWGYTNHELWAALRRFRSMDDGDGFLDYAESQKVLQLPEYSQIFLWDHA